MDELTIRPLAGVTELELFNRFPYVLNDEIVGDLAGGRRVPGWLWVALRGERTLARVAWWGRTGDTAPLLMDIFDVDDELPESERVEVGERLLRAALPEVVSGHPPQYLRFVPADWRVDPVAGPAVTARMTALERTGARPFVERLRLEWRAGTPVPEPDGRLEFRGTDRAELVGLMTRVLDGTLDAHSRADLAGKPPARVAAEHYDEEFARYSSPIEWHRVAAPPGGEPVGFVVPARNPYNAIIAYIGVLPEHRGKGYVDDILAAGTRLLAAEDVPRIRASTDLGNTPMAAAFTRTGYVDFEHEIDMVWAP